VEKWEENGVNSLFSLVFVYQVKLLGEVAKPLRVITKNQSDMNRYLPESDTRPSNSMQPAGQAQLDWFFDMTDEFGLYIISRGAVNFPLLKLDC